MKFKMDGKTKPDSSTQVYKMYLLADPNIFCNVNNSSDILNYAYI